MADRPKSFFLGTEIAEYIIEHGTPPDDVQRWLIDETEGPGARLSMMQISPEQGAFMHAARHRTSAPSVAVEVGTFTGYSALCIARGPRERRASAVLRRERGVDGDRSWAWAKAGVADRIELRIAPAIDTLRALPTDDDDRPRVHRRRQDELRRLLRGAAARVSDRTA